MNNKIYICGPSFRIAKNFVDKIYKTLVDVVSVERIEDVTRLTIKFNDTEISAIPEAHIRGYKGTIIKIA